MRRSYLPFLTALALLVTPITALPVPPLAFVSTAAGLGTVPLAIANAPLLIERPADWQEGGVRGLGIVHSFIGDHDGLPAFSVQHDPDSRLPDEASNAEIDAAVEDLFGAIVDGRPGYMVDHAGWVTINGLRVHSSLTGHGSVAGPMMVRRLILAHDRAPIILAWTVERDDWPRFSALIEKCVASLRSRTETVASR